jgi:hypothetical protein
MDNFGNIPVKKNLATGFFHIRDLRFLASGTEKWEGQKPGAWLREEKIYQRLFFG